MFKLLLALAPVGIILLLSEFLWRKKIVKGERARKFIHILAGAWMAFWPVYLSFRAIIVLGIFAILLLLISRLAHLFHAIYEVKRRTYGDVLFAVALVLCAVAGQEQWIFTVSILFMALADGGAAVIGRFWGRSNQYLVFGLLSLRKSVAGTIAFIFFAYLSIAIGWFLGGDELIRTHVLAVLFILPLGAAAIENTTPFGLDNLFTPLFATLLLNSLL